ncbi:MAG TPA: biopolymer transporter ExbD [Candidatus Baltobacteraceae bacterium]|nr:biopolymer transporter ExbD [Candidatus Baltobacteraceae bacterium]
MHFYVRKRRTTPAVIIVALIDVLNVLVIFLLVTTTFKQTSALKVALPESSQSQKTGANDNPPLIVTVNTNGVYFVDKLPVTDEQLKSRLKEAASKNPNLILEVNADEKAPWGKIVKVRDFAAEAKIKTLRAATKETAKP